ncbi:hypothetical protein LZ012_18695 [Dechloromonas sp. XY25]|uniref:Uncharacterized protein n=1 Tax=Dechloromonas hankyongensis TaxID=2908002 RepID=A0ABS9K7B8_9RHOO|nr:hypothetical protein [Dechloromonas hankyongensis]MCG2579025.1 hypothetical protein [Dechloromonas hankyongensis]
MAALGFSGGEALAASVDLVLVSYDPRQVYRAIYGAAQGLARGDISRSRLQYSVRRLSEFQTRTRPAVRG